MNIVVRSSKSASETIAVLLDREDLDRKITCARWAAADLDTALRGWTSTSHTCIKEA